MQIYDDVDVDVASVFIIIIIIKKIKRITQHKTPHKDLLEREREKKKEIF